MAIVKQWHGCTVISDCSAFLFFSYESMRDLCNRYSEVVDDHRWLVIFTTLLLWYSL